MKMNKWILVFLAGLNIVFAQEKSEGVLPFKPSLSFRVQPLFELSSENKNYDVMGDSATLSNDIKRAKLGIKLNPLKGDYVGAVLSFDLAKTEILRNAYIDFKWDKATKLKVGQFKVPFGLDFQKGGADYYRIYSSKTSDFISSFIAGSRHLGLGSRGKVKISEMYSFGGSANLFESSNVFTPGIEPIELYVQDVYHKINDFKLGLSWLSELLKRKSDESYRADILSFYASFEPEYGLFEVEFVTGDDEIYKYHTSLNEYLDYSIRELKRIEINLADYVKVSTSIEYEYLQYLNHESQFITWGLGTSGIEKESSWGVSFNWRGKIEDDSNGKKEYLWDEVGLLVNFNVKWK